MIDPHTMGNCPSPHPRLSPPRYRGSSEPLPLPHGSRTPSSIWSIQHSAQVLGLLKYHEVQLHIGGQMKSAKICPGCSEDVQPPSASLALAPKHCSGPCGWPSRLARMLSREAKELSHQTFPLLHLTCGTLNPTDRRNMLITWAYITSEKSR